MVTLDLCLYGSLAQYGGEAAQSFYAQLRPAVPPGTTMRDLLASLGIPLEEKGITFVNAVLTDMPGLHADLDLVLQDGDHIGIFSQTYMWPYQYRFGVRMNPELEEALKQHQGGGLHHSYAEDEQAAQQEHKEVVSQQAVKTG